MRFDNASIVVYYCLIQMNIINLGILAHNDAGKTSVTENRLFASGATEKCGRVDNALNSLMWAVLLVFIVIGPVLLPARYIGMIVGLVVLLLVLRGFVGWKK